MQIAPTGKRAARLARGAAGEAAAGRSYLCPQKPTGSGGAPHPLIKKEETT